MRLCLQTPLVVLAMFSEPGYRPAMPNDEKLSPAEPQDLAGSIAFALLFSGRKRVHDSDKYMAAIVADRVVRHLERAQDGSVHIWLDPGVLANLKALRGPARATATLSCACRPAQRAALFRPADRLREPTRWVGSHLPPASEASQSGARQART